MHQISVEVVALILSIISITSAYYYSYRAKLIKDAYNILSQLRGLVTWDERSEYKLSSWMNGVNETELHRVSLIELKRIRSSLSEYHGVHVEMLAD